jgi:hypothetical protein
VQNLKRVAMDCGSWMRLVRRLVAAAKSLAADSRKEVQKAWEPIGGPRRRVPPVISEVGPFNRERALWRLAS